MKITSKKLSDHREETIYHDTYDVRVQIKTGTIITMECLFEDGEFQDSKPKTEDDTKILENLSSAESNYLDAILEKIEID